MGLETVPFDVDTPQDLAELQSISQKISIDTLATEILKLAR